MTQPAPVEDIFLAALDRPTPEDRAAYTRAACAGDPDRLRRVWELLAAHDESRGPLDVPAVAAPTAELTPTAECPGTSIGPYKLLEQIGEGGFGVVFMAEQQRPVRRRVALKVLKPGMDTRRVIARFEAERQALALMDHPNIARVFDGGVTDQGRPFFAMELVKGVPITEFCDQNHLTPRERLELFVSVCQAVQHAHQKGIIHRDLKPSNVLVSRHDTTPVAKVIDFGVAKALGQELTDKTLFTGFAQMIGTPLYMSPEQAGMSDLDVDTRSDIYSLGVMLYELLTGTTPFDKERLRAAGYEEIRRIIREEEPARPSTRVSTLGLAATTVSANRKTDPAGLRRLVRGELDWIVMKCLEKDRNRRYETAAALVADVQRYLTDEPVQACPPSAWYRSRKFARRNKPAIVTATAATLAVVLAMAGLAASNLLISREQRATADALEVARVEAYFHRIALAHRELSADNLGGALKYLDECPADLRGWEWHYLMRLCKVDPVVLRDSTEVYGVAFSPDGKQIASAGKDGKVKIWDSKTGRKLQEFPAHKGAACSVTFHPDGRHIASAGADRLAKVWDLQATDQPVFQGPCNAIRKPGGAYTVAFRPPNGGHLAAGCDGLVRVWDWKKNQAETPEHTFPGPEYHSIPVVFTHDGRRLATGGPWPEGLNLWDAETWHQLSTFPATRHPTSALAFSTDGGRLASASLGRSASLWNTATGKLLHLLPHSGNVLGVAFSSDGRRLVTSGEDKTVHLWDTLTGREVLGLRGHTDHCGCVAFSPDGDRLASASTDRTIRIWDATPLRGNEGAEVLNIEHTEEIRSVAVSPDGRRVVSGGHGPVVEVWDAATGREKFDFPGHSLVVFAVAWHPDGRHVATAGGDSLQHSVKVWDASDGAVHLEIPAGAKSSEGPYQAVAVSPDGGYVITGKLEGLVQVWDAKTGQPVNPLESHDREIRALVFSRDGRYLASASSDGVVKLWDAKRLNEKQEPRLMPRARVPGPSVNVAFSPDSRRLVTGGERNTIKIWDVEKSDEPPATLEGHSGEVYAIAVGSDDKGQWMIASGGEDSTVKVWDGRTGKLLHTFRGHTGLVSSLAFSPDGQRLYSGSRDKTVKVWDLTTLGEHK